jgi:hypothetical protein
MPLGLQPLDPQRLDLQRLDPQPAGALPPARWRADCSRCAALCCLSLAFDRGEHFAFDKPAGEPCPLLTPAHACSIHGERASLGFSGCITYDCRGAGQRVTQEVFGGRSWQAAPELGRAMLEAFWRMRRVHELLAALALTDRLELGPAQQTQRRELAHRLDPPGGFDRDTLDALPLEALSVEVRALLAGLRERLTSRGSGSEPLRLPLVSQRPEQGSAQATRSASHTTTSSRRAKWMSGAGPVASSPCAASIVLSSRSTAAACSGHAE